jgi:hypothetical protein
MTEVRRLAILVLCLCLVAVWIGWGALGGQERRCVFAVTIGTHKSGYQEVPCDGTLEEKMAYIRDQPEDFRPSPESE